MVFWRKKKNPPVIACYGKLPATGDFVRLNATGPESSTYDQWLGGSVHYAKESLGDAFDACYQPATGVFIYRGQAEKGEEPDRGMVGVWASSGDSAGRRYPMTLSTCYDYEELLAVGPALPIAVWNFLAAAYDLAVGGRQLPVDAFLGRVAELRPIPLEDPDGMMAGYQRSLQSHTMGSLWETTFGRIDLRYSVLHQIRATVEIFRGHELPETALAIRFPLLAGDTLAAAVWTDITLRLGGWDRTVLNSFWTPQHDLMLHIGSPQSGTFRELIVDGSDAEHVTDLLRMQHADEATARQQLGSPLAELADDPNQTIAAFLHGLKS
jgi:type VI secretion system protein ImpM